MVKGRLWWSVVSRRADLNCEPSGGPLQNGLKPQLDTKGSDPDVEGGAT